MSAPGPSRRRLAAEAPRPEHHRHRSRQREGCSGCRSCRSRARRKVVASALRGGRRRGALGGPDGRRDGAGSRRGLRRAPC
jgi:hypothetical protein